MAKIQFIGGKLDFSFIKLLSLSRDLYFLELNFVVLEQIGDLKRCLSVFVKNRGFLLFSPTEPVREASLLTCPTVPACPTARSERFLPTGAKVENGSTSCQRKPPCGSKALEEVLPGTHPPSEPKRSLSAHVTGTQAINFSAQNQGAAAELKLTGHWVGTDNHVGSQKLQTGGLQNKTCWKPLSEMNTLLSFSLFFSPFKVRCDG